jgi:hypothetical protein
MFRSTRLFLICLTLVLCVVLSVRRAEAQPAISSELLLPYFEVELDPAGQTTLFAVGNALDQPVDVVITLHTNWGVALDKALLTLAPREMKSFNLRDWLSGKAPGRNLNARQVAHLKAALSGQRSPQDSMFYGTPVREGLAVGYVRIKTQGPQPAALWGDSFLVDPEGKTSEGEALVAIGQGTGCPGLCGRHILRYLLNGDFDAGTEIIVWTEKAGRASTQASADAFRIATDSGVYSPAGDLVDGFQLRTLPVQRITLGDLAIKQPFGWLDLRTEMDSFVAVRYRSRSNGSALLRAWCLPEVSAGGPGIKITKLTNGQDANLPPGPSLPVGSAVLWEYVVANTGDVELTGVEVEDDQGVAVSCPKTTLQAGESMTCTGHGTAVACQYANLGTVTAQTREGVEVKADDPSHYFGEAAASIDVEKLTNGEDADAAPGPNIEVGSAVTWTYVVKNPSEVALSGIAVTDDREGAVACPKRSLRPGESMTCTKAGKAVAGQYRNVGTATGETACGKTVRDEDASHYFGIEPPPPPPTTTGDEGCTPGYWKNHADSWPASGYATAQKVQSTFSEASRYAAFGSASLLNALSFQGGAGVEGGVGNLLRAATASLLNAAHPGVDFPRPAAGVISDVNAALASGNRDQMLALAANLDRDNNLGCPLN